jgi:membrane-bound serine protease (ClpP class)
MSIGEWTIFLISSSVILVIAELFLPTHGILGLAGIGTFLAAIILCFVIDKRLGLSLLAAGIISVPVTGIWLIHFWPRTRFGRAMVLQPVTPNKVSEEPYIQMGETGRTVSELRPVGICEFSGRRVEAISEIGIIPRGKSVQIVDIQNRRPTVRAIRLEKIEGA